MGVLTTWYLVKKRTSLLLTECCLDHLTVAIYYSCVIRKFEFIFYVQFKICANNVVRKKLATLYLFLDFSVLKKVTTRYLSKRYCERGY